MNESEHDTEIVGIRFRYVTVPYVLAMGYAIACLWTAGTQW